MTPSSRAGSRRKFARVEDVDMEYSQDVFEHGVDGDESGGSDAEMADYGEESEVAEGEGTEVDDEAEESEEEDEVGDMAAGVSNMKFAKSRSSKGYEYEDSDVEVDETLVVSEADLEYDQGTSRRRQIALPTAEASARGVSTEQLREQGWDDDHITLVQKLAMRGFEPLLPQYWNIDFRFLPDGLFSQDDNAFISCLHLRHNRGVKALERLLELGGRVRDQLQSHTSKTPEQQVRIMLKEYLKWSDADAGLDKKTAIPILAIETKPANTEASILQANAKRKLTKLANRYREAFKVSQSIENSPRSHASTTLSYPIPTLYAIIASHTLIALVAYRPDEEPEPQIKSVAFFDMKDRDYDVWNALAVAIIVCHVRNVQLRVAEDTGLGVKNPNQESEESSDPDA